MGQPRPARRVITVAGTNGKGSTVATACALLSALGYRQGAYTSPHILRFNERICSNGREISDEELVSVFEQVETARGDTSLTYFEFTTLAALAWLSRQRLDFAVLEVGLGGRLDAVNLVDADCAVITPIGLDHQEFLGDDREQIGREKAGIMRAARPVVISDRDPPTSVLAHAARLECPQWRLGREFDVSARADRMRVDIGRACFDLPQPVLPGPHQLDNAAAALVSLSCLLPALREPGADELASLSRGLREVQIAGRLQQVSDSPPTWIDVGHNPLAAAAIGKALATVPGLHVVLGMLRDKDCRELARALAPQVAHWYCASLPGVRGQGGDALAGQIAAAVDADRVEAFASVASALEAATRAARRSIASGGTGAVLVTGSFITAAEAMLHLGYADRIPLGQGEEDNN